MTPWTSRCPPCSRSETPSRRLAGEPWTACTGRSPSSASRSSSASCVQGLPSPQPGPRTNDRHRDRCPVSGRHGRAQVRAHAPRERPVPCLSDHLERLCRHTRALRFQTFVRRHSTTRAVALTPASPERASGSAGIAIQTSTRTRWSVASSCACLGSQTILAQRVCWFRRPSKPSGKTGDD